jgi:hypothetical protein
VMLVLMAVSGLATYLLFLILTRGSRKKAR